MNPLKFKERPEHKIQKEITNMLVLRGWLVKPTHGDQYQSGFPDLYCTHSRYGSRWVEVKLPGMKGSRFTSAQMEWFPKFCANGSGVWILTGATETEYQKLFKNFNWWEYTL